jgi:hypothetical protein
MVKVTNPELIRLHRSLELREYALAAFYPLTHSGISAHHKRAVDRLPVLASHPLLSALRDNRHQPESIANQRPSDEPKPWKKPWDK